MPTHSDTGNWEEECRTSWQTVVVYENRLQLSG